MKGRGLQVARVACIDGSEDSGRADRTTREFRYWVPVTMVIGEVTHIQMTVERTYELQKYQVRKRKRRGVRVGV